MNQVERRPTRERPRYRRRKETRLGQTAGQQMELVQKNIQRG
jgi:hypothetical protein